MIAKIKKLFKKHGNNIFLGSAIVLISVISFNLGRISAFSALRRPLKLETANLNEIFRVPADAPVRSPGNEKNKDKSVKSGAIQHFDFRVVVSKKSTSMKYHFLWCPGAGQIKEENKVYFENEEEAQKAGYTLAGNCTK